MRVIERAEVARRLTYEACIPIVRQAMIDFSSGVTRQLLRSIIPLADGRLFGIMPGALGETAAFGAKLISVWPVHGRCTKERASCLPELCRSARSYFPCFRVGCQR
jgi:ornithine cyclodeaminase/alanine dehydrogenase-like protein (mu-crystallin family)